MNPEEKPTGSGDSPSHDGKRTEVELRRHRRVPLGVPIECRCGPKLISGRAENISAGGLLVRAEQTFPWDEEVSVTFVLPGSTEALQVRTRVAHVVPDAFMGLEFFELSAPARERIEQYLSTAPVSSPKRN